MSDMNELVFNKMIALLDAERISTAKALSDALGLQSVMKGQIATRDKQIDDLKAVIDTLLKKSHEASGPITDLWQAANAVACGGKSPKLSRLLDELKEALAKAEPHVDLIPF